MTTDFKIRGKKDNSKRRYIGGGPRPDRAKYKREEAEARAKAWAALSIEDKIDRLDRRLGRGEGAKRQRARLEAQLAARNERRDAREKVEQRSKKRG